MASGIEPVFRESGKIAAINRAEGNPNDLIRLKISTRARGKDGEVHEPWRKDSLAAVGKREAGVPPLIRRASGNLYSYVYLSEYFAGYTASFSLLCPLHPCTAGKERAA